MTIKTDISKDSLLKLRNEGLTRQQMADELGISVCSLKRFCRIYHIFGRHYAQKPCAYCGELFRPFKYGSIYCSAKCRLDARLDRDYHGGLRRTAIGFEEKECWICHRIGLKRMHAHHVVGKENSMDLLVILCAGCHTLVSELGRRNFLGDTEMVEDLLTLARFVKGLPNAKTKVTFEEV